MIRNKSIGHYKENKMKSNQFRTFVINDTQLIQTLQKNGYICEKDNDSLGLNCYKTNLKIEHGQKIQFPNQLIICNFGTLLYFYGRDFEKDYPDQYYICQWIINDNKVVQAIQKNGYYCNFIRTDSCNDNIYETNLYVKANYGDIGAILPDNTEIFVHYCSPILMISASEKPKQNKNEYIYAIHDFKMIQLLQQYGYTIEKYTGGLNAYQTNFPMTHGQRYLFPNGSVVFHFGSVLYIEGRHFPVDSPDENYISVEIITDDSIVQKIIKNGYYCNLIHNDTTGPWYETNLYIPETNGIQLKDGTIIGRHEKYSGMLVFKNNKGHTKYY